MIIPTEELLAYRADLEGSIFRQIRHQIAILRESGSLTQRELATRIGMDQGHLSRILRGERVLKLSALSDLARGIGYRIDVTLTPIMERSARLDEVHK